MGELEAEDDVCVQVGACSVQRTLGGHAREDQPNLNLRRLLTLWTWTCAIYI